MNRSSKKQYIRNPSKWVGKYVRHMANWQDFQWGDMGYIVCEWTGKLVKMTEEAYYGDYFETLEEAHAAGYDECCYYCDEGLYQMYQHSQKKAA
jgi:hypothetical protein